jgi:hypothetical protein
VIDSLSLNSVAVVSRWSVVTRPQVRPPSRELETRIALIVWSALTARAIWCAEPSPPKLAHGSEARS